LRKSSILKAILEVRFLTKENLCTRFIIKFILRKNLTINATIAIILNAKRLDKEKKKLLDFKTSIVLIDEFSSLINDVKKVISFKSNAKAFSDDVLRVKILRLEQSYLTFVNLFNLIHVKSRYQFAKNVQMMFSLI